MKRTDEVTITITLAELAKAYAVLGKVYDRNEGESLYSIAQGVLDPEGVIYWDLDNRDLMEKCTPSIDYCSIQDKWEDLFFEPEEADIQRKIRELKETAAKIQQQIKELEEEINNG